MHVFVMYVCSFVGLLLVSPSVCLFVFVVVLVCGVRCYVHLIDYPFVCLSEYICCPCVCVLSVYLSMSLCSPLYVCPCHDLACLFAVCMCLYGFICLRMFLCVVYVYVHFIVYTSVCLSALYLLSMNVFAVFASVCLSTRPFICPCLLVVRVCAVYLYVNCLLIRLHVCPCLYIVHACMFLFYVH